MITQKYYYDPSNIPQSIRRYREVKGIIDTVGMLATHDLIHSDSGLKRVDLSIFRGNKPNEQLKHKFLKDFSDEELSDLVERNEGRLPLEELREIRTLLRQLELDPSFKRPTYLCEVCNQY